MKFIITLIFSLLISTSWAQVISVTGANATGTSIAEANDYIVPPGIDGPLIFERDTCALPNYIPGFLGNDFGTICYVHAKEDGTQPQYHRVSSIIGVRTFINGDNTSTLHIKWKNTGSNYATSDGHYAEIHTSLDLAVAMAVTGVAPGTPMIVYYWYTIFGSGNTDHEDNLAEEDSIRVVNSMEINGNPQFGNEFDFASPNGLPGWNERKNVSGNFKINAGVNFTFSVSSNIVLYLQEPPGPGGFGFGIDQNYGNFIGNITFAVFPEYPPIINNTEDMLTLFSLDIGSDAEMSDPKQDGNEYFDPGDLYAKSNIGPLPAVNPWLDDLLIFGHDPDPKNSAPVNPAPVGAGLPVDLVEGNYFDLDGSDLLATSLSGILPLAGDPSIPYFSDSCAFEAEYLFVSFDDDGPEHYTSFFVPSVPVNSSSPFMAAIYSDFGYQDEIMEFVFDAFPASGLTYHDTVDSEYYLHPNLAPDPLGNNDFDDDADALDMIPVTSGNNTPCTVWYFSADHEARYNHPLLFPDFILDPATIYTTSPAGPVPVIDSNHHDLPTGTDINAFEFAWVWDFNENRFGLALLFSVDVDDPLTPADESGGLNPAVIYYSFMNGSSQPFSAHPLMDNIDGLTVWKHSLNGTISYPNPTWGTKTWTGSANQSWQNNLNWFPLGVPFDPEDVLVPNIVPSPVIGINGMDCNSLVVEPGGSVILQSGNTFTIKGP